MKKMDSQTYNFKIIQEYIYNFITSRDHKKFHIINFRIYNKILSVKIISDGELSAS